MIMDIGLDDVDLELAGDLVDELYWVVLGNVNVACD